MEVSADLTTSILAVVVRLFLGRIQISWRINYLAGGRFERVEPANRQSRQQVTRNRSNGDLTFASWNLISGWLTLLDTLRRAA